MNTSSRDKTTLVENNSVLDKSYETKIHLFGDEILEANISYKHFI